MSVDSRLTIKLPPIYCNSNHHGRAVDPTSHTYTVNVALFALTSTRCPCFTSDCNCGSMLARDLGTKCAQQAHSTQCKFMCDHSARDSLAPTVPRLRRAKPQNQILYVPKSSGSRAHFASLYPLVKQHFVGVECSEKDFWGKVQVLGALGRGKRWYRNPSRTNSLVESDPAKVGDRPMYYLNACMLDAYGSKADELVVRRRLEDHKVGALLSPELLQTEKCSTYLVYTTLTCPRGMR